MRRATRLLLAITGWVVIAGAVPVLGLAGPPVVTESSGNLCGIQGTWVNRIVNDDSRQLPGGVEIGHFHGSFTFTSAATGKAIEFLATGTNKFDPTPVDNGDGTYSLVTVHSGSGIVIKVPNGPVLTANAGAGHFIIEDIFDAATGDYITTRETRVGGRTLPQGGDFCADLVVPALT
jgi:hypothetical protein